MEDKAAIDAKPCAKERRLSRTIDRSSSSRPQLKPLDIGPNQIENVVKKT